MKALEYGLFASLSGAMLFVAAKALGAEGNTPPEGWELPPPLSFSPLNSPLKTEGKDNKEPAKKANKKPVLPACCAYDKLCCTRQSDVDARVANSIERTVSVSWSELPYVEVKRAPIEKPGIEGVPPARIINENGQLFPWPTTPKGEVRFMPPGQNGETLWRGEWATPYFGKQNFRGMGYGSVHFVEKNEVSPDKGASMLSGPAYYLSFSAGQDNKIIMDRVRGTLNGSPVIQASAWAHVETPAIVPSLVNAYREKKEDKTGVSVFVWEKSEDELKKMVSEWFPLSSLLASAALPDCERVVFVLPEVLLGFESKDVKTDGGHFPDRRESAESYTRYTLPAAPGFSGWVTFFMNADWVKRWFPLPKDAPKLKEFTTMALSSSQTQAEAQPRLRVIFFKN